MTNARWRFAAIVPSIALVVGWGCDSRPSVSSSTTEATVKGTVTIKGKPPKKGEIVFDPANYQRKDVAARTAKIKEDGTYTITTLVGGNSVRVAGPEAERAGSTYTSIDFDVQPGENTLDISLPKNE
jgi:hypothetical protein